MPKASRHYSPNRGSACCTFHSKLAQTQHLSGILTKQTIFNGLENQHLAREPSIPLCVRFSFFFFLFFISNLNHRRQGGWMDDTPFFLSCTTSQSVLLYLYFFFHIHQNQGEPNPFSFFDFTCSLLNEPASERASGSAGSDLISTPYLFCIYIPYLIVPFYSYLTLAPLLVLPTLEREIMIRIGWMEMVRIGFLAYV